MSIVGHGSTPKGKTDTEGTFGFGPEQNIFRGNSLAAAALARDDYANDPANEEWLQEYLDARLNKFIALEDTVSNIVHIQSYDRKAANWTPIWGSTYGTQPAIGLDGGIGTENKYYDIPIFDETQSDAIVAGANAALANGEPWALNITGQGRLEQIADATNRVGRRQQSIWGRTFTRANGNSFTFPDDPADITRSRGFTLVTPFVDSVVDVDHGTVQRLRIPEGNGDAAGGRIRDTMAIYNSAAESAIRPWHVSFTDSGSTARDLEVIKAYRDRPGSGAAQRWEYVFLFANNSAATGDVTGYDVTANFIDSWPVRFPFAAANAAPVFTAPSDVAQGAWNLEDPMYFHAWFTISALSGNIFGGDYRGDWNDLSGRTLHEGDIVLSDDEYYIVITEHTRGSTKPDADDTNFKSITYSGIYRGDWGDLSGETLNRGDIVRGNGTDVNFYVSSTAHTRGTGAASQPYRSANYRLLTGWNGAYTASTEYPAGAIVTHSSKIWIANAAITLADTAAPGASGATKWTEIS